jgi:DNA-binding transcriptional LysR family regulator
MVLKHSHLRYFATVAETGQITSAARVLHIAQPALSQAISQLEAQLGVKLLERHPRGVTLTAAGAIFLEKAQLVLHAEAEAAAIAASLARSLRGTIQIGFLSIPPTLIAPNLLEGFNAANPELHISSRELRFPTVSTASWLADVDIALCHSPIPHPDVEILPLRHDARAVLLRDDHRLADREALEVADVISERFYGFDASVDPEWAAFWSLDDHRGGAALTLTGDHPSNALEMVAAMSSGRAVSTMPAPVATIIADLVPRLLARPLNDADPAICALVWHASRHNPIVDGFVELASALAQSARVVA